MKDSPAAVRRIRDALAAVGIEVSVQEFAELARLTGGMPAKVD